ncbi:ARM repeat-containing protein [Neoconidiobolus thromboides FSU 785]|nr:ARM repeat-containing protein [Neoconidiobolus thromboides FSU 785]
MQQGDWKPNPDALKDIIDTFNAAKSSDNEVQRRVFNKLESYKKEPEYALYLAYIIEFHSTDTSVSQQAAFNLKNLVLNDIDTISHENQEHIKNTLLRIVDGTNAQGGKIYYPTISALIRNNTIHRYAGFLEIINRKLKSSNVDDLKAGLSFLTILIEDCSEELDQDVNGTRPLVTFIPLVINLISHQEEIIRVDAIENINVMIHSEVTAMEMFLDTFANALFQRTQDTSIGVHTVLCKAFINLLSQTHSTILTNLNYISGYMLNMTQSEDQELALEACEFWLAVVENQNVYEYLRPYLPDLIPVLVRGMVYDEDDAKELVSRMVESSVPDSEKDLKPRFHQSKIHEQVHQNQNNEEDDEDIFDEDEDMNEWNIRKCSAATLDQIASLFGNDILPHLIPLLQEKLYHKDWLHRECGILILGAISEGCTQGLEPHLPNLIEYLIKSIDDEQPLIRTITCWAISRYSQWIIQSHSTLGEQVYFLPTLSGFQRRVVDKIKRVQDAGTSAITTFVESCGDVIIPYIKQIVETIITAFPLFQAKNLPLFYDFMQRFFMIADEQLNHPDYINAIMPLLVNKYQQLNDEDYLLSGLFEVIASFAICIGNSFAPYSQPIYQRALNIIVTILGNPEQGDEFKDMIIVSLDLIAAIVQALGEHTVALANSVQPSLVPVIATCLKDDYEYVKQSAYALLGDISINSIQLIANEIPQFLTFMVSDFEDAVNYGGVCNNLVWSCGEIACRYGSNMIPYMPPLLEKFLVQFSQSDLSSSVKENLAVTIGRFGLASPETLAPYVSHFLAKWCETLYNMIDNTEKITSFQGVCLAAKINPSAFQEAFIPFLLTIENLHQPSPELVAQLKEVLLMFRNLAGDNWEQFRNTFPARVQKDLQTRFGI